MGPVGAPDRGVPTAHFPAPTALGYGRREC